MFEFRNKPFFVVVDRLSSQIAVSNYEFTFRFEKAIGLPEKISFGRGVANTFDAVDEMERVVGEGGVIVILNLEIGEVTDMMEVGIMAG